MSYDKDQNISQRSEVIHPRRMIIFCFGSACSRAQPGGRSMSKASCLFVYLSVVVPSPILWTAQLLASGALFKVVAEEWLRVTSQTRINCYEQAPFLLSIAPQISIYYFHFRMNKDKFWNSSATITNTKRWSFHSELSISLDFLAYLKDF